jgi:hypothetical protein
MCNVTFVVSVFYLSQIFQGKFFVKGFGAAQGYEYRQKSLDRKMPCGIGRFENIEIKTTTIGKTRQNIFGLFGLNLSTRFTSEKKNF